MGRGVVRCGVALCGVALYGVPKALLPKGNGREGLHSWDRKPGQGCAWCVRARSVLVSRLCARGPRSARRTHAFVTLGPRAYWGPIELWAPVRRRTRASLKSCPLCVGALGPHWTHDPRASLHWGLIEPRAPVRRLYLNAGPCALSHWGLIETQGPCAPSHWGLMELTAPVRLRTAASWKLMAPARRHTGALLNAGPLCVVALGPH